MSIRLDCPCRRTLTVADSYAHLKIQCPSCRESLTVPAADPYSSPASGSQDAVQPDLQDIGKKWGAPQGRDEDYDYNSEDNPSRRREVDQRFVKQPPSYRSGGGFGSINAGVGGGLLMMGVGVLIFLVCLGLGRISIYGPILFIIGLIALARGAFRSNE